MDQKKGPKLILCMECVKNVGHAIKPLLVVLPSNVYGKLGVSCCTIKTLLKGESETRWKISHVRSGTKSVKFKIYKNEASPFQCFSAD